MLNIFRQLCAACALLFVAAAVSAQDPAAMPGGAYNLQAGDVLQIAVWKEPDLTAETLVRPDGSLSFPLAGELKAAGATVDQLRGELETRLRKYVPEASVSISLKLPQGNRIYVIGKVSRPGDFMLVRGTDVMQALSLAGGATPFADVNDIRILRRQAGRLQSIPFHYSEVERGRHLDQNIVLQGGDTVVVP